MLSRLIGCGEMCSVLMTERRALGMHASSIWPLELLDAGASERFVINQPVISLLILPRIQAATTRRFEAKLR